MDLSRFDHAAFLRDVWQQKPMLIRQPWTAWHNPLEPNALAGLACEEDVESRLIVGGLGNWSVEHGPVPEHRFAALGEKAWTLLVQAVNHHVPEVAALLEPFRFIPNWRIDDVMVSYAADGGGVGPHFDRYDVFLVQGLGQRRWRIGGRCDDATPLLPHDDLRLLADFEASEEWVLEPGDVLYIPPGFAHDGVAVGSDCMTYSIGFRAPSRGELIEGWTDAVLGELSDDDRYTDAGLHTQPNPGEISSEALAKLHAMVAERLLETEGFARWFGRYSSARKYPDVDWRPEKAITAKALRRALDQGAVLERNPASRFAFVVQDSGAVLLFVDGECYESSGVAAGFAQAICAQERLAADAALAGCGDAVALIVQLFNHGSLVFAEEV
ncbi:MAG: cupin domain-containing protein [Novosphingobium sp.]